MSGASAPGAIGSACVHDTSWPTTLQVQSVPPAAVGVIPAGSVSVTVATLDVATLPTLVTRSVYAPVPPERKSPLCRTFIERSGSEITGVVIVLWLSPAPSSSGVETFAVLTTDGSASVSGRTLSAMSGAAAPAAIPCGRVQVTVCPTAPHVHPVPTALTYVRPAGRLSVTVATPGVTPAPMFVTESVYALMSL